MVESLQMFLFLFKSKYRRKYSWFSPFLCSVLIVLLFCHGVLSRCEHNCINGVCNNDTCVCYEGWQGPQCQHCGGKIKLTAPSGVITDGPGNYSVSTQCSWLITPPRVGPTPPTLRVRLESFATECGWDHLYIYDGDSVRAEKLLAVFSGMLDKRESNWTRQVIARSGSVLLHFFSDDAYAMEGFNLTYAAYSCPSNDHRTNCSDHGECEEGSCRCEPEWVGVACDQPMCPNDCNAKYGAGFCTSTGCECTPSRTGPDCSRDALLSGWGWAWREEGEGGARPAGTPPPAAGHALLNYGEDLLRVGGEMFQDAAFLYRYKPARREWEVVEPRGEAPLARFAHTAVVYGEEIIVYGGVVAADEPERGGGLVGAEGRAGLVSNELWVGHVGGPGGGVGWRNATPRACSPHRAPAFERCGGLHLSGHTAVLVHIGPTQKPVMLVFFGHSPHYGYLHLVQEYYIEEGAWSLAAARGAPARGGFAHSAAWDALSGRVYLHAGLVSESESTQAPSAALYEYEVEARIWRPLPSAPTPRYLHSAIFISPGIMLVFGGNAHNDSAAAALTATGASQCYASSALLYNARCRTWQPASGVAGSSRAGHAAALLPGKRPTVIVHGGFDGRLRSDALSFSAGARCSSHKDEAACLRSAAHAVACVWKTREMICVGIKEVGWKDSFDESVKACLVEPVLDEARCAVSSCESCAALGCAWCGSCLPSAHHCLRARTAHALMSLSVSECPPGGASCSRYHSCAACHAHLHRHPHGSEKLGQRACYWDYDTVKCRPANSSTDIRSVAATSSGVCSAACATFSTCANCTAEECIWCASAGRCVDKNAYGASFPLGGCRAWSTSGCAGPGPGGAAGNAGGLALAGGCGAHPSCQSCLAEPACGWCDDGAGGGRGTCLPGSDRHPHHPQVCPRRRWHFTSCPACQCNGHAVCDGASRCVLPCGGRAFGPHCNTCAPEHWGSPLNGGQCTPCECNGQASSCAAESGRCHCSTKGLAGDRCDKCDNTNHYHADLYNKGCYYDLAVDYQFTFNLSKKEDRHLSAINFRNAPVKPDVDADFTITCSAHARMNLTVRTKSDPERTLFSDLNCTNFKYKFAKSDHAFGVEDNVTLTTFFVYVYDFRPPLWIQISFSQYPKLNLQQFFITFSSCFLLLLLVAAALWKIKQKYDLYRRRQRLFVEMEQMASRPFSQVSIELERGGGEAGVPAPVALEPCRWGRAAVLSLVVRLPAGGAGRAPPQGGLALASALVTLGHAHHAHHDRWRQQCK